MLRHLAILVREQLLRMRQVACIGGGFLPQVPELEADSGELAAVIARISERPRRAISPYLIQDGLTLPLVRHAVSVRPRQR